MKVPHAASCPRLRQRSPPMPLHPNVKLAPKGLETLVSRIESGSGVDVAARQMGVSCQAACPQQARQGSSDCDSRPCIYLTAAAGAPSEGARTPTAGVRAPAPRAYAWRPATSPASPTPSFCPTSGKARASRPWPAVCTSSRATIGNARTARAGPPSYVAHRRRKYPSARNSKRP